MKDCFITIEKVPTMFIDKDGNRKYDMNKEKYSLTNVHGDVISHEYICMIDLGDDHYAVCDLISDVNFWCDYNEYDIIEGQYDVTTPKMKWGIIRLSRSKAGNIIPRAETFVAPYIYDRISSNNLKTATVKSNDKYSYVDLDIERDSYGEQLVPCILNHAVPFCVDIEGFAECSVGDTVGYLPRDTKPCKTLEPTTLLSEEQAQALEKLFTDSVGSNTATSAMLSYFALTGVRIDQVKSLRLSHQEQ